MSARNINFFRPSYNEERGKLFEFLSTFEDLNIIPDQTHGHQKYMIQLQKVANHESKVIEIFKEDLEEFFHGDADKQLLENIFRNTKRYIGLFCESADELMPARSILQGDLNIDEDNYEEHLQQQRLINDERNQNQDPNSNDRHLQIPKILKRRYELYIVNGPGSKLKVTPLRNLRADVIGSLVNVRGIVTKVSEVRPIVNVACYICEVCGFEVYQTVNAKVYMPLVDCPSTICKQNRTSGKLIPNNRASKFTPYQDIRIQETTEEIPVGSIPRSFNVVARGENTRKCSPGDIIFITGAFVPSQFENTFRSFNIKLIHDTYIDAFKIVREKKRYSETVTDPAFFEKLEDARKGDIYTKLAKSIAPEIYGLDDIKKALLLLMIGGQTQEQVDGMKIRGDINIALIGDPGVAKSQLLKQISMMVPRGVYTTGKGSSGVGLTAAVIKDPYTKELSLEGGALVLADMGICCIDEFDKMDEYDRTVIHEVMEQQTVSIAKAGITTTLNARTSILAAANPIYGRYNRKMTPHQNINLPAALLSRFDLVFILLDKPDRLADELLSRHIAYVHQKSALPIQNFEPFSAQFIRSFISEAKKFNPKLPKELHTFIIQRYIEKRKANLELKPGYVYTTPRTLLGIIRLAQASARLRFSDEIDQNDVDEALRLMDISQASVMETLEEEENLRPRIDAVSSIFSIVTEMCKAAANYTIKYNDLEKRVLAKGHLLDNLKKCLDQYSNLGVLMLGDNGKKITLVNV